MDEVLAPHKLAYLHVVEGATGGPRDNAPFDYEQLRARFDGAWMVNNGYDRGMANDAVAEGRADLVAFSRPFISNPDLVRRLRELTWASAGMIALAALSGRPAPVELDEADGTPPRPAAMC